MNCTTLSDVGGGSYTATELCSIVIGVGSRGAPGAGVPLALNNLILSSNFHQLNCSYIDILWRVSFCDISAPLSQNILLRL